MTADLDDHPAAPGALAPALPRRMVWRAIAVPVVVVLVFGLWALSSVTSRLDGLERQVGSLRVRVSSLEGQVSQLAEADGSAGPTPSIAAIPTDQLTDRTSVSVAVSGFTPGSVVSVLECLPDAQSRGLQACDQSGLVQLTADSAGQAATTFAVRDHVATGADTTTSCRVVTCYLAAAADAGHYAYLPLAFAR